MANTPAWFPLSVGAVWKRVVRDGRGDAFAQAAGFQEASEIVLVMNAAVKRDLGVDEAVS